MVEAKMIVALKRLLGTQRQRATAYVFILGCAHLQDILLYQGNTLVRDCRDTVLCRTASCQICAASCQKIADHCHREYSGNQRQWGAYQKMILELTKWQNQFKGAKLSNLISTFQAHTHAEWTFM